LEGLDPSTVIPYSVHTFSRIALKPLLTPAFQLFSLKYGVI
jgi:hypothetical protein